MRDGRGNTTIRNRHRRIIARGHPRCAINGCEIDYTAHHLAPNSFTIDHIIPINRGGTDTLDNLQPACRACNRTKADKLPGEPNHRETPLRGKAPRGIDLNAVTLHAQGLPTEQLPPGVWFITSRRW